jgi:D-tagatose-1,6-bisphosphate aldolase subunit GatZ/KbaZ
VIALENKILQITRTHKSGQRIGITSICSANPFVIKAAINHSKKNNRLLLIEATSNQVDQFGGYTGLTPALFRQSVLETAQKLNFPSENLVLGGDHLGPNRWQNEKSETALEKAREQISAYINAGFCKIHLDASMKCADDGDRNKPLDPAIAAERSAILCKAAEDAAGSQNSETLPVYIIGTDVPPPGGAKKQADDMHITQVEDVGETIRLTEKAFQKYNLTDAWERVIGIVVQPGVEFGDAEVCEYDRNKSKDLAEFIEKFPSLVYEAHSTDYQKKESLSQMVKDHFAILKVGPWLTYKFREAVFSLALIEEELLAGKKGVASSNLIEVVENRMLEYPDYWEKYYSADEAENRLKRKYSYSDRIRYYWSDKKVNESLNRLISNLSEYHIPHTLLSQYLPEEYTAVRAGTILANPEEIIQHRISGVLDIYHNATTGG